MSNIIDISPETFVVHTSERVTEGCDEIRVIVSQLIFGQPDIDGVRVI
ncbi:hypothetical protein [Natrinema gari]|nr:hypothetical protein [Natrinema gari]